MDHISACFLDPYNRFCYFSNVIKEKKLNALDIIWLRFTIICHNEQQLYTLNQEWLIYDNFSTEWWIWCVTNDTSILFV